MAIGRISGSMLKSNLTRNGVDLAFETNILYLDVTNARVGIGTSSPSTALQVDGTTTTTGLVAGGLTYPTADGSNGQVLTTNGTGTLSFTNLSPFTGITFVGDDSSGSTINTAETLRFTGGNNITTAVVNDIVTITGSTNINVNEISSTDSSAIQINDSINVSGNITLPKETNASVIADTFITRNAHIEAATTAVVNLTVTVGSKPADGKWFGQGSTACYYINGVAAPYIDIQQGKIYRFNQSAASNSTHPINIYYDEYKSRVFPDFSGSSSYVTQVGTAGTSGAYTELYIDFPSRGRLSYQCQNHAFMGSFIVVKGSGDPIQFVSDDSSGFYVGGNESVRIAGGNSIDTTASQDSTDTITIALSNAITINEISSTDSTAIQINDGLNVAGQINVQGNLIRGLATPIAASDAATKNYVDSGVAGLGPGTVLSITAGTGLTASPTNPITSTGTISLDFSTVVARVVGDDSTGTDLRVGETVKIAGGNNITTAVSGDILTITGSKDIDVNSISSGDSSAIQINDGLNVSGTLTANTIQTNELSSNDSTAVQVADGMNVSGTLTAPTFVTNDISSNDSTAIQVNDGLNVSGTLTASGLVAGGLTYPTTDGTPNQVLATNGAGTLSFTSLSEFTGITFVGDDSTGSTINTAETLKFTGASGITTAVVNDTVTITGPNLSSYLTNSTITVVGDDSTGTTLNTGETVKIAGGNNITTAVSGDILTITGSKDIDVNSISSGDSSAIQINDGLNVSGTFHAATIVTNDLISEDSTAINVLDGMNVSGTLTANTAVINNINTSDSSDIHINGAFVNFAGGGTVLYDEQATLNNLYDVEITNPQTDQFLRYNGAHWVNGQGATVSAGVGVGFWLTAPTISGVNANNANPIASLSISPGTITELTITKGINGITDIIGAFVSGALNRTVFDGGNWLFSNHVYVDSSNGTSTITDAIYTVLPFVTGTVTITGTGTSRTATASAGTPFATAAIDASAVNTDASFLQTPQGLYQITARSSDTVVTITTPSGYTNESAVAGTVWKKWFVGNASAEINSTTVAQYDTDTTKGSLPVTTDTRIGLIIFGTTTSNRTVSIVYDASLNASSFTTPLAAQHKDLAGLQGGQANEFYHLTAAEYTGTGTGAFVRTIAPDLTNPHITGSLHVTTIDSTDSTTIEINSGVDVNGTLLAPTFITNNISSSDSTAIQIDDAVNVGGTLNVSGTLNAATIVTNDISSGDSTAVQINDGLNVSGTLSADVLDVNEISSSDSSAIQINDAVNVSGTFTAKTIVTNDLTSEDSTAIQINDAVNISGILSVSGNVISNVSDPIASQDAATKNYVDSIVGGSNTLTIADDTSTTGSINLDNTLQVLGGNNITTSISGSTLTISGDKIIDVNEINSGDSSAIQINDAVNISGTLNAKTIVTNDLISEDSTAINVLDGMNVSGTLSADVLDVNEISSSDSSAIQINDGINVSGVITGGNHVIASQNLISSNSSGDEGGEILLAKPQTNTTLIGTGVTIDAYQNRLRFFEQGGTARGYYVDITEGDAGASSKLATKAYVDGQIIAAGSGTVTSITAGTGLTGGTITTTGTIALAKIIDVNEISSSDSSAIQINDAVNISGILSVSGNVISNVSDPIASQDAATKNYVDSQLSSVSSSFLVADDTSTIATIDSGDTLRIIGSGGITTAVSGDTLTIVGSNPAQGITFFDEASTSTAIPDGGALQITSGAGISTSILGNVITITNTSTQLEIDGGSAYSVYNAISEALIDGGTA